jgi:nucleoside-diphosphate-sugar epimerase
MSNPTAVVTGASGFIGSHLVERLVQRGYFVRALGHSNSESRVGNLGSLDPATLQRVDVRLIDILDISELEAAFDGADVVFHLAAQISVPYSFRAPSLFIQTNVSGTLNVLQASVHQRVRRVVVISSSEVYGGTVPTPMPESQELQARSPYAASKIGAEKLAEAYWHTFQLGVVALRPFNTFGPRQSARAVIPWIVSQALASDTIVLGNVEAARDLVYITDTTDGMIAAAEVPDVEGMVFNLATGQAFTVRELVSRVGTQLGRDLVIAHDAELAREKSREVWTLIGDASRAADRLNWRPRVSIDEGISHVIAYMRGLAQPETAGWSRIASRA